MSLVVIIPAAIVAGAIQNIAGFGAGVVLMLILPYFFDLIAAPALNSAICTFMTIIMAVQYRKWTNYRQVVLPCICFMASSTATIWTVKGMDLRWLGVFFGIFMILLSLYFIFVQKNIRVSPSPAAAIGCGLVSGVLSGLFSIGSTTMALYFLAVNNDRKSYMGGLQTLLAVTNVNSLITRITRGIYTVDLIIPTIVGFAALLTGQFIGSRISGKLDKNKLNMFIYIMVGFTGAITLVKQIMLLV